MLLSQHYSFLSWINSTTSATEPIDDKRHEKYSFVGIIMLLICTTQTIINEYNTGSKWLSMSMLTNTVLFQKRFSDRKWDANGQEK